MLPLRALRSAANTTLARNRWAPISFADADHGLGGSDALAWFDALLAEHGIADAAGEVWLQTYPRIFGFTFKPVSFWYAHRADGSLCAVVAEVNNTFGERHCYLIEGAAYGQTRVADKVFHVSPFCSVAGEYRFRFMRTQADGAPERLVARVELHQDGAALIHTSVSGELQPINQQTLRRATWSHPLITLGVLARIHWQALRLSLKRVPFHSKPRPPEQFVSR